MAKASIVQTARRRFSIRNRRRKAELVRRFVVQRDLSTAILIGVGGKREPFERVVEDSIAEQVQILGALDIYEAVDVPWPYVCGSGLSAPFRTRGADLVFSNAVIEHVGDAAAQQAFVAEHGRSGCAWVMTTPNRWFPVESHTMALFRHWSSRWRRSRPEFTRLLSRSEFRALLPPGTRIVGHWWSATFTAFSPEA